MASKITIKRSLTAAAPAGLSFGEMAFVQGSGLTANQLYVGISGGNPAWVGAQIGTTGTWTDNAAKTSLATQFAIEERITSKISGGSPITTVSDNTNTTRYLVFGSTAAAGVTLFVDDTSGPLSYNPSTAELTLGGNLKIAGDIVSAVGKAVGDVFASVTTRINIGLAATGITMGSSTGTIALRNPTLLLGTTASNITTTGGTANNLTISPYGNLTLQSAWDGIQAEGSLPSVLITNNALSSKVQIAGGDLTLATKGVYSNQPVNIVFEGASANNHQTTLTVTDPTADRTITLPDDTGTVALTQTSVASFNGVTGAVTGVSSFNGLTGAVSGLTSGGPLGTPLSGTLTNCTGLPVGTGISGLGGNVAAFLATPNSANFALALTDETGSNVVVFGTSPAITTSLTTPSTSFDLLNTTATTVNFAGAGLTLNIGNASGTATFGGNVIVNGDFTVQGNTTTLNTTTLNVEDFNITMGLTLTNASQCTGAGIGIGVGTGITFAYDHSSLGWLSSVNMDLASGKVFKIGNASVLSGTTLGSLVVASSLTSVGTITSGTWSGSFGAVSGANLTNLTAGNLSGTIPSAVLANSIVNIGTTGVALNRASAPLVLTGISSIDGSAATVTTAAQPAITSVGTLTSLTVSGTLEAGLIDAGTF